MDLQVTHQPQGYTGPLNVTHQPQGVPQNLTVAKPTTQPLKVAPVVQPKLGLGKVQTPNLGVTVNLPDGRSFAFPNAQAAAAFKQAIGFQESATPEQGRGVLGNVGQFFAGAGKGALSTLNTISGLGQKALGAITPGQQDVASVNRNLVTPSNMAQKIGFGAEQVGEFFIPGGAVNKATKAVEAGIDTLKAGKVAGALKLGAKSAIGAAEAAGVTALQGGDKDEVKNAAKFGAAFPIATKVIGKLGSAAKETAKFISSSLSGVPKDAIEYALKNPKQVQSAINRAVTEGGDMAAQRISQNALDALDKLKEARRLNYKGGLSKLEKEATYTKNGQLYVKRVLSESEAKGLKGYVPGTPVGVPTNLSTNGVKKVATTTLKDFGINAKGRMIDWSEAAIDDTHAHKLQKLVNRIYDWSNTTPTGLNNLRQIIDSYTIGGINLGSSEKKFNAIIGALRTNLSEYVGKRVPQVAEMTAKYKAESEVIDAIRQQLKLGSSDPNTALRKLINVFNPKSKVYRPIVEQLGDKAGVDLMSDIAGLTMAQWTPEGLGKYMTSLIGGAQFGLGLANPASFATIPATAVASSPRVVGKAATTLGKIDQSKAAKVVRKVSPTIGLGAGVQVSR
jgi:hypothetical protein